ncbi:MAG TPA: hypothetical protein VJT73_02515, partial [Polyangiaceae bacterium]|nr:hypothetical protein [Polyangiaceae bacterium]
MSNKNSPRGVLARAVVCLALVACGSGHDENPTPPGTGGGMAAGAGTSGGTTTGAGGGATTGAGGGMTTGAGGGTTTGTGGGTATGTGGGTATGAEQLCVDTINQYRATM